VRRASADHRDTEKFPPVNIFPIIIDFEFSLCYKKEHRLGLQKNMVKTVRKNCIFLFLMVLFFLPFSGLASGHILLKNAKIYTMGTTGTLARGMILITNGKVEKIGPDIPAPSEIQVFDLSGKTIIPGMVCVSSSLFLDERDLRYRGDESPDTDILEGIHYLDPYAEKIYRQGVTTAYISPVSFRSFGGLGAVVKTASGESGRFHVLREKAALSIRLDALQDKMTSSVLRLTQYHRIRDQFREAQEYGEEWEDYKKELEVFERKKKKMEEKKEEELGKKPPIKTSATKEPKEPKKPKKDEAKEILLQAMDKKIPVRFAVHRPDSILHALNLGEEFGLDIILVGAENWPTLLDELIKISVPILTNPLLDYRKFLLPGGGKGYAAQLLRIDDDEFFYSDKESVRGILPWGHPWEKLAESGIPFAVVPPDRFPLSARFMRFYAGLLASEGIPAEIALGAVTVNAAKILGVSDRLGSLEEGKDADLVVLDGEPLNSLAKVEMVFVDGVIVWKNEK
jgi:imidazolonepropionase-like amidohydrolase